MSKLFKPKTLRRIILSLFLLIPFFITFVPAIAFLLGSHGVEDITIFDHAFVQRVFFFDEGANMYSTSNPFLLLGYAVIDGQAVPLVFEPIGQLFRFIDGLHLFGEFGSAFADGSIDWLYFWYVGVVVYQVTVVLIYEIVVIALKLLLLPLRAVEAFERKGDD